MSLRRRLIARLDIKGPNLIKPVRMEGLRIIGDPNEYAKRYTDADELVYIDTVASLYGRNNLTNILERTTSEIFIPVTVGGGIRSLEDVHRLFGSGADKVALNTGGIRRPALMSEIAERYGSQALVCSIEAKRTSRGWECYTDNGRERTGLEVLGWVKEAINRGAGEILLTSIDMEGTMRGFDLDLIRLVAPHCPCPLVACGGMGNIGHLNEALEAGADAIAMASVLHYNKLTIQEMRNGLTQGEFQDRRSEAGGKETRSSRGIS